MRRLIRLILVVALFGVGWILLRAWLEEAASPAQEGSDFSGTPSGASGEPAPAPAGANQATKAELYEQAKRLGIARRSKMTKQQLADAIDAARSQG